MARSNCLSIGSSFLHAEHRLLSEATLPGMERHIPRFLDALPHKRSGRLPVRSPPRRSLSLIFLLSHRCCLNKPERSQTYSAQRNVRGSYCRNFSPSRHSRSLFSAQDLPASTTHTGISQNPDTVNIHFLILPHSQATQPEALHFP